MPLRRLSSAAFGISALGIVSFPLGTAIADHLDGHILPEGYFAEVQVHIGNRVEVDIATFEDRSAFAELPLLLGRKQRLHRLWCGLPLLPR